MFFDRIECVFCRKTSEDSELIDMGASSIVLNNEMLEFSDLIKDLLNFALKLPPHQTASTCEECKNLLIQLHLFKQNVKNNSLFAELEDENIKKVTNFLEENEDDEVSCLRYNKCLTLVPSSKRSFIETLRSWQPNVVLNVENIADYPPTKRKRVEEIMESEGSQEINKESGEIPSDNCEAPLMIQDEFCEETLDCEEIVQDEQTLTEEEWLEIEIKNCEIIEGDENNGGSWVCSHCEAFESFNDLNDFRMHLVSAHLNYDQVIVDEKGEVVLTEDDMSEATSEVMTKEEIHEDLAKLLSCPHCKFSTENRSDLRIHKRTHLKSGNPEWTLGRFYCHECCYQFKSQSHYQAHVNGHSIYEIVAKHATHPTCTTCNLMFCEDPFMATHKSNHTRDISQVLPSEGTFLKYGTHRSEFEPTVALDENAIKCGHCMKKFASEESCRLHQLIFHATTLRCPIEDRVFNGNQAFSVHLRNNHPELFGDEVKFLCSVCKMEFDSLYNKLKHMKTCDQKKYECSHCDKKFSQKCYLMSHLKRVNGEASVTCPICEKVCRDKGDYQIHARSHSDIKPFKCSICPKAYKTSSARAAHLETHLEKGFSCVFCSTKFNSRRTLQKHIKTRHHKEAESNDEVIEQDKEQFTVVNYLDDSADA